MSVSLSIKWDACLHCLESLQSGLVGWDTGDCKHLPSPAAKRSLCAGLKLFCQPSIGGFQARNQGSSLLQLQGLEIVGGLIWRDLG